MGGPAATANKKGLVATSALGRRCDQGQKTSIETQVDFELVDIKVEQRPLARWGLAAHLSIFIVFPAGMVVGMPWLGVVWFFAAVAFFVVGLSLRRRVKFRITSAELIVDAWMGLLPRPRRVVLPLLGIHIEYGNGSRINGRRVYTLESRSPSRELLVLPSLACSKGDLDQLARLLREAEQTARLVHGQGVKEIPKGLQRLRQVTD